MKTILKGMTWSHDRGVKPLVAAAEQFMATHPEVTITWDARSLADFELYPLDQLASKYDMIMIDHPHIGTAFAQELLRPLESLIPKDFIEDQKKNAVGKSHLSYFWEGKQWALAADAAAQFSAYQKETLKALKIKVPVTWTDVESLALSLPNDKKMAIPFVPVHAYSSFFSLCSQVSSELYWSDGKPLPLEVGSKALGYLNMILSHSTKESFYMDPITMLDRMAQYNDKTDLEQIVYCPLTYGYSTYSKEGYAPYSIKFDGMPSDTGKPEGSMIGGVGLSISSKCDAPEVAAEFIQMVVSGDYQKSEFVVNLGQPGHRDAWLDDQVNAMSDDFYKDTLSTMDYGSMRPRFNGYIEFQETAGKMIRQFFMDDRKDYEALVSELNIQFMKAYNNKEEA